MTIASSTISFQAPAIWAAVDYKPFAWQYEHVHSRDERFVTGACARRTGKSSAAKAEVYREIVRPPVVLGGTEHPRLVYVVAPTYELSQKVFEPIYRDIVPDSAPLHSIFETWIRDRRLIILRNGARIQAKTSDNEKSLAGDAVTLAVVDEAHAMTNEAMAELQPALSDLRGRMFAFGIPQTDNWFRGMYMRGIDRDATEMGSYYAFSVPFLANPHNDPTEQELMRTSPTLTEREWRQRYLAEWVEIEGSVFHKYEWCFDSDPEEWHEGGTYIMGLDVAKMQDFTVAYVIDAQRMQVVAMERFNRIDWPLQVARVGALYRRYHCQTSCTDTTAFGGDLIRSMLQIEGIGVSEFKLDNTSKAQLVNTLAASLERRQLHLLRNDEVLKNELSMFRGEVTGAGNIKYNAAPGYHDDCVIALGLAVWKARRRQPAANRSSDYLTFGKREDTFKERMARRKRAQELASVG